MFMGIQIFSFLRKITRIKNYIKYMGRSFYKNVAVFHKIYILYKLSNCVKQNINELENEKNVGKLMISFKKVVISIYENENKQGVY